MFAGLLSQILALTSILSGHVCDPQNLPVPGARVVLVCETQRGAVDTDERGRFALVMPAVSDGCRLVVTRVGFAPFEQRVGRAADVGRISLRIGDVTQRVDVLAEPAPLRSIGSVMLSDSDLRTFAGTTADLIGYARMRAGGTMQPGAIYVDGLPATALPPLRMIASISVNADPFSAERSDGDVATVEIITKAPSRTFNASVGSDVLGIGGGDPLAPDGRSASAFQNIGLAGALPGLPLTFVASAGLGSSSTDVALRAVVPGASAGPDTARTRNRSWSGSLSLYYAPDAPFKARVSYRQSNADAANLGAGGIFLPEAASSSSSMTRDARATLTWIAPQFLYEGNVLISQRQWNARANSDGAGIMVSGDVVMGGAPIAAGATRHTAWTSKHVLRSRSRTPWIAGVTVSGTDDADEQTPNPSGTFEFTDLAAFAQGMSGGKTATWFVTRGNGSVHYSNVQVAPFVQRQLLASRHVEIAAGARADYQSGVGTIVSPRLSLAASLGGFNVRAGSGLFVKDLPSTIFVIALKNDGQHLQQFMVQEASLAGAPEPGVRLQTSIRSGIAPAITRPREFVLRLSIERPLGRLVPALEYTWARGRHLLGSERTADELGWLDQFDSNRAADRQRLHAQLHYSWKGGYLSLQYEWVRSRDNTNGPFSFAERPGDLAAEWARSAGVAPRCFTAMGSFTLPAQVSANVTYTWRSSSPYDITTGLDAAHNGLFLDRGGRSRNSGTLPGYSSLDAFVYRRVQVPNFLGTATWRMHVNIGLQASNILNRSNPMAMGSIVGAMNFGRPLAAYPGRSIRLSLSID